MGKIVVEYKNHYNGIDGVTPTFIFSGTTAFYNRKDKTSIGIVDDDFYIPDTLIRYTKSELITRQLNKNVMPQTYVGNTEEGIEKTNDDATATIEDWWQEHMENN